MSLLDDVMIAAPCNLAWDDMPGNDRVRHCRDCNKNVYNISAMTKNDAEQFLRQNGTSECLRIYRRADGTILTDNCPVGLRKLRDKARNVLRFTAAVLSNILAVTCAFAQQTPVFDGFGNASENKSDNTGSGFKEGSWANTKKPWNVKTTPGEHRIYDGYAAMPPRPVPKKGTTFVSDDCSLSSPNQNQANAPEIPSHFMGKPAVMPAVSPNVHHPVSTTAADTRAISLFGQAQIAEQKGDLLVAFALYQDAIRSAQSNPKTDPTFMKTLERSFQSLRSRVQNPVLVDPNTGMQMDANDPNAK